MSALRQEEARVLRAIAVVLGLIALVVFLFSYWYS